MRWRHATALVPGVGVSLLPKLTCPLCWPAYAGILSALGLGFLINSRNLLVMTALFLTLGVAGLAFRARQRRGYGPALVGIAASATILVGKFYLESPTAMYVGVGFFIAASLWNSWPAKPAASCPRCAPNGHGLIHLSAKERLS